MNSVPPFIVLAQTFGREELEQGKQLGPALNGGIVSNSP
jgi:hypothetical protein